MKSRLASIPLARKQPDPNRIQDRNKRAKELAGMIHKLRQPVSLRILVEPTANQ